MHTKPLHETHERTGKKSGNQKRDSKAKRIDAEHQSTLADGFASPGKRQDGPEHRTDTGGPAEGKRKSHDIGRTDTSLATARLEAQFTGQEGYPKDAKEV